MPWRAPGRLPRACGRGRERVRTTEDHRETGRDLLWGDRGWLGMRGYGYYLVLLEIWAGGLNLLKRNSHDRTRLSHLRWFAEAGQSPPAAARRRSLAEDALAVRWVQF